jgi:hypothetical protein
MTLAPGARLANAPVPAIGDTLGPGLWDARYGTLNGVDS